MKELEFKFYHLPDVSLHVATAGEAAGETIVMLHGFPEYWYGWHKQLSFFASHGYHVVAPDQRGYNLSSKPQAVEEYTLEKLAGDIIRLISQLGKEKVVLLGHDWGGIVGWVIGMYYPHLLQKLILLNIPHPAVMLNHLKTNPRQMLRSWYAALFQVPAVPEKAARLLDFRPLEKAMTGTAKPGTFSKEDMAAYKEAWQQQGALTSMINWYRAFKYTELSLNKNVEVPTLMIWGKKDTAPGAEMAEPSIARCPNGKLIFLDDATHWLHHEQPDRVNEEILAFLRNK
ncbi:alpha/beta hydrolase [Pontibacter korlensis]|uniref:Alpha/beta hydrolase n=1 Tax=Pontibacter korlensis TaxID=400092 RepID=A0A0E3ZGA8_9BACT|nr:alpha/beta hydrolase [Pontibacter korlensis]AKD04033.1 alpha/beta hydrolase [Pontibacter korlensis]